MRLFTPDQLPQPWQGLTCRQSRLTTFLFTATFLALAGVVPAISLWHSRVSWWLAATITAVIAFFAKLLITNLWRAMRSTNWLLRVAPDGLWTNIRSYANCDFAPAPTVIQLPYSEIESVHELIVKRAERERNRNLRWKEHSLEIRTLARVPEEVAAEITAERRRTVSHSTLFGAVTYTGRTNLQCVTVPEPNLIRIAWHGRYNWTSPSLRNVFVELRGRATIEANETRDDSNLDKMSGEEIDRLVLRLAQSGDRMGAIKLLTTRRGYTLTAAHQFLDALLVRT